MNVYFLLAEYFIPFNIILQVKIGKNVHFGHVGSSLDRDATYIARQATSTAASSFLVWTQLEFFMR
jgi:hypothetical protein